MKLFDRSKKSKELKVILFVCVENSGRSQIAEGFFRKYTAIQQQKGFAAPQSKVLDILKEGWEMI